jgi:MFS family permease
MYIDAASYFASALFLALLSVGRVSTRHVGSRDHSMFEDFKAGLRYIRRDRLQFGLLILIFLGWWVSGLNSLQTPLAKGVLRLTDEQFGWFNGVWGAGFVIASLLLGWYGTRFPKGRLIAMSFLGWAVATGVAGVSANAGMLFAAVFWVGFTNIVLFVSLATTIMEVTPSEMLGRVITARQVALALVRVTAMLGFGLLADLSSVRLAILSMAGVSVLGVMTGLLLFPEVGRLGSPLVAQRFPQFEPRTFGTPPWQIFGVLLDSKDLAYGTGSQRRPNIGALLIVGTAWIGLLITNAGAGVYVLLVVAAAIAFKPLHEAWASRQG